MRITNSMIYTTLLAQLNRINEDVARYSEQVASGKRINRPSDDPQGTSELLALRDELVRLAKYNDNILEGQRRLGTTDGRLNDFTNSLTRTLQLIQQGASTTTVGTPRIGIAQEIREIQNQLLGLADSQIAGRYIFAGTRTTLASIRASDPLDPPDRVYTITSDLVVSGAGIDSATVTNRNLITEDIYVITFTNAAGDYQVLNLDTNQVVTTGTVSVGSGTFTFDGLDIDYTLAALPAQDEEWIIQPRYQYNGNDREIELQVDENTSVVQNVPGSDVFGATGSTIFDDLVDLRFALLRDDTDAIRTNLDTFRTHLETLEQRRARVGGRISNLRDYEESSRRRATDLMIRQIEVENVDLVEAITKLTQTQGGLQAALAVTARLGGLNLFNFMR